MRSLSDSIGEHGGDKASRSRAYAQALGVAATGNGSRSRPMQSVSFEQHFSDPEDVHLIFDDGFLEQQEMLLRRFEEAKSTSLAALPEPELQLNSNHNEGNYEARFMRPAAKESFNVTQKEHVVDLLDPVIREQKRIYEEIQTARKSGEKKHQHQYDYLIRNNSSLGLAQRSTISPNESSCKEVPRKQGTATKGRAKTTVPDQVELLGDGKKLRIKGTHHAVKSVEKGEAVIVMCPSPSCKAVLQVDKKAKNVFCVFCKQIAPLSSAHSALDSSRLLPAQHDSIARSVQRQEFEVAVARKAAKLSRNDRC